jgi:hypothetical protein
MRHRVELIPERLRVDVQAFSRHHPHLALEGEMIGVLRDRHAHAKFGRIPAAGEDLGGARRCDHCAIARAPVLLADVMLDLVRQLDRRDPLRVFRLARHLGQLAAARRTGALIGWQLMTNLHDRQRWL